MKSTIILLCCIGRLQSEATPTCWPGDALPLRAARRVARRVQGSGTLRRCLPQGACHHPVPFFASAPLRARPCFRPQELGFKLVVVAIGYPEAAKELCEKLPFPADLLFLDPEMKIYTELHLNAGLKYFFNRDTLEGCRELGTDEGKAALARYSFIKPPNAQCTLQMGGLYVVDSNKLLYGHMDKGLGAHAPNDQVLAACAAA
eukprot:366462-Chlamydomonas_euryale.AAC.21